MEPCEHNLANSRRSGPLLKRENKSFRYFATGGNVASKDDADVDIFGGKVDAGVNDDDNDEMDKEEEQRLEDLMEQATQEFRSYLKNQVCSLSELSSQELRVIEIGIFRGHVCTD